MQQTHLHILSGSALEAAVTAVGRGTATFPKQYKVKVSKDCPPVIMSSSLEIIFLCSFFSSFFFDMHPIVFFFYFPLVPYFENDLVFVCFVLEICVNEG